MWVFTVFCISSHLIIAGNTAVVSFRGQHHIQLCLVRPSLTLIPGIESQGQRVVITQIDFLPVPEDPTKEKMITNRVDGQVK